jgi:hypothetical protein
MALRTGPTYAGWLIHSPNTMSLGSWCWIRTNEPRLSTPPLTLPLTSHFHKSILDMAN